MTPADPRMPILAEEAHDRSREDRQGMNILHITPYYRDAWGYGGIPRVASSLACGLARAGGTVTVCTTDAKDAATRVSHPNRSGTRFEPHPTSMDNTGVALRVFSNLSNRMAYHLQFFWPLGLKAYLRHEAWRFDIAHIHGCHHLPGTIAARELKRCGVPYVVMPNGTLPRIERRLLAKWLFDQTFGRGMLEGASLVLAVTQVEAQVFSRLKVPPAKIRILPNPICLEEFQSLPHRGAFRHRFGLTDRRLVLYLGKITPRKGVDLLVRAFARLKVKDAGLVIAGNDMGFGGRVRQLVRRLKLEHKVVFTGLLEGERRLEALVDADLVVYAGRHEIFGLVALEALLCGTPVIVADDSGCTEVIGQLGAGQAVPAGDPEPLCRAMEEMLAEPAYWRKNIAQAQERIAQRFDEDVVASQLLQIYQEVLLACK